MSRTVPISSLRASILSARGTGDLEIPGLQGGGPVEHGIALRPIPAGAGSSGLIPKRLHVELY